MIDKIDKIDKKDALNLSLCTPLEILDYYREDILIQCKLKKWISMKKIEEFLREKNIVISQLTIQYWANLHGFKLVQKK